MIRKLTAKDKLNFLDFCSQRDPSEDFYITKDNKRQFLDDKKVAESIFGNCLRRCDICYVSEKDGMINGILLITGISEKADRKYLKILSRTNKVALDLLKYLNWHYHEDLHIKINLKNPIIRLFKNPRNPKNYRKGYKFLGGRGAQILLLRSQNGNDYKNNKKPYSRPTTTRR